MDTTARGAVADVDQAVSAGARLGYVAVGVLHLVLGWIAVQLAWGGSGASADQTGALAELGSTPFGAVLLWVLLAGFALLTLWQAAATVTSRETTERVKSIGKAVVYLVLTALTAQVATGDSGGGGSEQTTSITARVMQYPLGAVAVGLVGAGIVGVGVFHVVKGWRATFLRDLRENPGRAVTVAGRVGYIAKGVALGVVGALFVVAAWTNDPEEAQGLDGALRSLLELPLGTGLLTAVGLGLAAYGVYSFGRARHARV